MSDYDHRNTHLAHPKLFVFDLGVRNVLMRRPRDRPLDDERGLLLEHLVAYELHRRLGTPWRDAALFHYRTRHGAEVDFVLQVGRELWAIEVKASRDVNVRAFRGLAPFAEQAAAGGRLPRAKKAALRPRRALPLLDFLAELPA
jgi:predicted AAA+ superfamily ATPase